MTAERINKQFSEILQESEESKEKEQKLKILILDSNKPILRSLQRAAGLLDNVEITAISEIDAAMEKLKKGELLPDFIYLGTFSEPD